MWIDNIQIEKIDKWLSSRTGRIPTGNRDPYTSSMRSACRFVSALNGTAESRESQLLTDLASAQLYDKNNEAKSVLATGLINRCKQLSVSDDNELAIILVLFLEALRCDNTYYKNIIKFWYSISKMIPISELSRNISVSYLLSYLSVADKNTGYVPLEDVIVELSYTDLSSVSVSSLSELAISDEAKSAVDKLAEAINSYATRSSRTEMFQALDIMFSFDKAATIDLIRPIDASFDTNKLLKNILHLYSGYFSFSSILYECDFLKLHKNHNKELMNKPLQQIYYGAPGTGKSYKVNQISKQYSTIRTTFHPDSDYSSFVGAYKPTMSKVRKAVIIDKEEKAVKPLLENSEYEEKIKYSFVKQAFLKAYLGAWKKFTEPTINDTGKREIQPQFLVIEEINRGNCAQIFGDLFQLLDRQDNGFSCYPIDADDDLRKEIENAFKNEKAYQLVTDISVDDVVDGYASNYQNDDWTPCTLSEDIRSGRVLLLPNNLYIWATMNTSDQSLFPIDSAFKRRWKWKYMPIEQAEKGLDGDPRKWKIEADGHYCYWWEFLQAINNEIEEVTHSEDKQLGYYFCKPESGEYITAYDFVSKVVFYLWNDIFKDEDSSIFQYEELDNNWKVEGYKPTKDRLYFRSFISSKETVDEKLVRWFINNLLKKKEILLLDDENQNPVDGKEIAYMRKKKDSTSGNEEDKLEPEDPEDGNYNKLVEKSDMLSVEKFSKPEYYSIFGFLRKKLKENNNSVVYTHGGNNINNLDITFSSINKFRPCYIAITLDSNKTSPKAEVKLWIETDKNNPAKAVNYRDALKETAEAYFSSKADSEGLSWRAIDEGKEDTKSYIRGWRLTKTIDSFDIDQHESIADWLCETITSLDSALKDKVLEIANTAE